MGLLEQAVGIQSKVQFIVGGTATGGQVVGNIGASTTVGQSIKGGNVVITLDASIRETHKRESPATKFEVEDGTTVSDHIIIRPFELQIEGLISDTPISVVNELISTVTAALLPPVGIVAVAAASALSSAIVKNTKPSLQAYAQILNLQQTRAPFNVLTTLNLYQNMFITSLSVPREAATGNCLLFTVSLSQLILVQPQTVNLAKFLDPTNGGPLSSKGAAQLNALSSATQAGIKTGFSTEQGAASTVGLP